MYRVLKDCAHEFFTQGQFPAIPEGHGGGILAVHLEVNGVGLAKSISLHAARAVSDRPFKNSYAAAVIIIEGDEPSSTLTNAIVTPGGEHDGSAHRAELSGNYVMVLLGSVTLRCDGQSALYRSFSDLVDEPSFNLITTIHNFLRN